MLGVHHVMQPSKYSGTAVSGIDSYIKLPVDLSNTRREEIGGKRR